MRGKLKRATHTNETNRTKDTSKQAKVNTKRLPEKRRDCMKIEDKEEEMLHSTTGLF